MTPAPVDHESRRRDVSEAVWRVLARDGFGGLRLRAVAAEMNASTGLLTHYFSGKRELLRYALGVLEERTNRRPRSAGPGDGRPVPEPGLAMLRATLLDMLPLDAANATSNRIWVGSWDAALADPELAAEHARRYADSRERLAALVAEAQARGEISGHAAAGEVAAAVQAFVLGLVVQVLLGPGEFPGERQVALVDGYLGSLAG